MKLKKTIVKLGGDKAMKRNITANEGKINHIKVRCFITQNPFEITFISESQKYLWWESRWKGANPFPLLFY